MNKICRFFKKYGHPDWGALFLLAAIAAAAVVIVAVVVAAAAAGEQQNQDNNPPAVVPTKTIVAHNEYLLEFFER